MNLSVRKKKRKNYLYYIYTFQSEFFSDYIAWLIKWYNYINIIKSMNIDGN